MKPLTPEEMIDLFTTAPSPYAMLIIAWGQKITELIIAPDSTVREGKIDVTSMLKSQPKEDMVATLREQIASGGVPLGIYTPRPDEGDLIAAFPWETDEQTKAAAEMIVYLTDLMYEQQQRGTEYTAGSLKKYRND
jgi:hypothetical protein